MQLFMIFEQRRFLVNKKNMNKRIVPPVMRELRLSLENQNVVKSSFLSILF